MKNCKPIDCPVIIDNRTYEAFIEICNKGINEKGVKGVFYASMLKSLNDTRQYRVVGVASTEGENLALHAEYIDMPEFLRAK